MKFQEESDILRNGPRHGSYCQLDVAAPQIAAATAPGQFVHLRIPLLTHRLLRRPFSIYDVDPAAGTLSIIYKIVGEGTQQLAQLPAGVGTSLLGPLGHGYTVPPSGVRPVIVAGGYGCAATYLLAKRSPERAVCLFGARTAADLLLIEEFQALGCEVRIATDDGSRGHRGFVTDLLAQHLSETGGAAEAVYACGPNPMLRAVGKVVAARGLDAEISLDHAMCCGVGACFACVIKQRAANPDGWEYVRTCTDGPVFRASTTVWD